MTNHDPEPSVNISGGENGGGRTFQPEAVPVSTKAATIVDRLGDHYWRKTYGDQGTFECLVRTVLSQNTSDTASQPAHDALIERYGEDTLLEALAEAEHANLASTIRQAGLYNQKARRLIDIANEILHRFDGLEAFETFVETAPVDEVRRSLLSLPGVGPKTADCVLVFGGGREGVFPVDTHVHRVFRRLGVAPANGDPETVKTTLEAKIPPSWCGFGHTTAIQFGRDYCSAQRPACLDGPGACPLFDSCDRIGVDLEHETVIDPAETD